MNCEIYKLSCFELNSSISIQKHGENKFIDGVAVSSVVVWFWFSLEAVDKHRSHLKQYNEGEIQYAYIEHQFYGKKVDVGIYYIV